MRITFVLPHIKIAGGTRILLSYAHHLACRGHEVQILVEETSRTLRLLKGAYGSRAASWVVPGFKPSVVYTSRVVFESLPESDVVIAGTSQYALACARHAGLLHFVQHDDGLYHESREVADSAYKLSCPKVAVSTWVRDVLISRGAGGPVHTLLNPISRSQFFFDPKRRNPSTVRILMLNHPYAWKGTQEGARVFSEVRARFPNIKLVLFSVKHKQSSVACDEFHHRLAQEELASLYSSCDIYLCPSWDEGSGLPSMEAMLCHAALVTYDNGGSRDFAFDGKTAFVAPRRDEKALISRLMFAVEKQDSRETISAAGAKFIASMPEWPEQVTRLERIMQDICR